MKQDRETKRYNEQRKKARELLKRTKHNIIKIESTGFVPVALTERAQFALAEIEGFLQ